MDRLLSEKESLGRLVPWGRTTLWRKVRDGGFPAPRAVSENRKAWLESEIAEWMAELPVVGAYVELQQDDVDGAAA